MSTSDNRAARRQIGRHRKHSAPIGATAAVVAACIAAGLSLAPSANAAPGQAGITDNGGQAGVTNEGGQAGVNTPTPEPAAPAQEADNGGGTTEDWDTYIPIPVEYQNAPTRSVPTYNEPTYYYAPEPSAESDEQVVPEAYRAPEPAPEPGKPVAPIQAAPDTYRFGALSGPRPDWLPREEADKLNNTSSILEAQGATFFNSLGIETTRSDRIAAGATAGVVLGAATGAVVAGVPAATLGAAGGAVIGTVAGVSIMGPVGAITVPIVGAVPGAVAGGAAGAGIGAASGAAAVGLPAAVAGAAVGGAIGGAIGAAYGAGENMGEAPEPAPAPAPEAPAVDSAPAPAPEPAPVIDLEPAAAFVEQNTQAAAQFADTATASSTGRAALEQATDWAEQAAPAATPAVDQVQDAGAQAASWVAEQPGGNQLLEAGADLRTAMPNEVNTLLSTFENAAA